MHVIFSLCEKSDHQISVYEDCLCKIYYPNKQIDSKDNIVNLD